MVKFQLRHGNDLLAMDSIRNCDVSSLFLPLSVYRALSLSLSLSLIAI